MANVIPAPPHNIFTEFFDNPYSAEALALPHKDIIVADCVDLSGLPKSFAEQTPRKIKDSNEEATFTDSESTYAPLHALFCRALEEILGQDNYQQARVYFDHFYSELDTHEVGTFWLPHLDGTAPGGSNFEATLLNGEDGTALKAIGFACDTLPTMILQGPTAPHDYYGETRTHLKMTIADQLSKEEIPVNKLLIMPPSLPHYAQTAVAPTIRHAVRWQVMIG